MGWRDRYIVIGFVLALVFWSALHLIDGWMYNWYMPPGQIAPPDRRIGPSMVLAEFKVEPWEQILCSLMVGFLVSLPVTGVYWIISKIVVVESAPGVSTPDQNGPENS